MLNVAHTTAHTFNILYAIINGRVQHFDLWSQYELNSGKCFLSTALLLHILLKCFRQNDNMPSHFRICTYSLAYSELKVPLLVNILTRTIPPPPVQYSHSTHTFTGCWAHRICGNFDFSLRYTYTSNAYLSVLQLPIEWQCILVGQPTLPALSHDVCNHSSAKAFQNNFLYSFALNISCDVHLIHVRFMWLLPFLSHIVTHTHTKLSRQLFSTKCHLNNSSGKHKKQHSNKIDC